MFKRLRQMKISLAAKCQLLFGAAVILIISAALFVPWQRMEQLTGQINERSARTLAESALREHVSTQFAGGSEDRTLGRFENPTTVPTTRFAATTNPTTAPLAGDRATEFYARLLPMAEPAPGKFNPFERRAEYVFAQKPEVKFVSRDYERKDGSWGYRYAAPLAMQKDCFICHGDAVAEPSEMLAKASSPIGMISVDIPSQIASSQLLLNRVFILTAGLVAGLLAIVVFYLVTTRLILEPVRVLQNTAEKVSKGDLNIRSDINTGDEFQQLSETFNVMLTNLKSNADQLRAINKSLDTKLGQLAESNVALYESNRLKSEFLANVSHELRTPLNSILGFADLLKAEKTDAKQVRYIQNILQSGKNLLDLINDLLDLAKIEAGRMEVRSEPLSLPDLFEGLTSILKPLTEGKNLQLETIIGNDVPILQTDPAKLQQILYNFLSNAIKFSPPDAHIDLSASREDEDRVRISVVDRGPGIQSDQQQIIFEKFRQIDGSATRQHSGTGLGLAISKELTSLLGGSIGLRSAPGEGSTFFVIVPIKIQAGAADIKSKLVLT